MLKNLHGSSRTYNTGIGWQHNPIVVLSFNLNIKQFKISIQTYEKTLFLSEW